MTFEFEPIRDMVRFTVTHDEPKEGSEMARKIANGSVLSSMKSFLVLGGLVTSTLLTLFVVPSLLLSFGKPATSRMALAQPDLRPVI